MYPGASSALCGHEFITKVAKQPNTPSIRTRNFHADLADTHLNFSSPCSAEAQYKTCLASPRAGVKLGPMTNFRDHLGKEASRRVVPSAIIRNVGGESRWACERRAFPVASLLSSLDLIEASSFQMFEPTVITAETSFRALQSHHLNPCSLTRTCLSYSPRFVDSPALINVIRMVQLSKTGSVQSKIPPPSAWIPNKQPPGQIEAVSTGRPAIDRWRVPNAHWSVAAT
jgi:hypothetical protein